MRCPFAAKPKLSLSSSTVGFGVPKRIRTNSKPADASNWRWKQDRNLRRFCRVYGIACSGARPNVCACDRADALLTASLTTLHAKVGNSFPLGQSAMPPVSMPCRHGHNLDIGTQLGVARQQLPTSSLTRPRAERVPMAQRILRPKPASK